MLPSIRYTWSLLTFPPPPPPPSHTLQILHLQFYFSAIEVSVILLVLLCLIAWLGHRLNKLTSQLQTLKATAAITSLSHLPNGHVTRGDGQVTIASHIQADQSQYGLAEATPSAMSCDLLEEPDSSEVCGLFVIIPVVMFTPMASTRSITPI